MGLLFHKHVLGILHKLSYLVLKNHPKLSYLYIMETVTKRVFRTSQDPINGKL